MYPVLFHIGSFEVRAWGLLVALGIIAGLLVTLRLAQREEIDADLIYDYVIYVVIAGMLGARIWEVVFSWSNYAGDPISAFKFWSGGLSIQGAVAGGLLYTIWFIRKKGLGFWQFADVLAPGLILGQAIGRIGCFLNGDAYGIPTSSWLGVVYSQDTPAYAAFGSTPLIPAELLEGAGDLLIFGLLLYLFRKRTHRGFVALAYFVLYSVLRFTLEFWRGDSLMVEGTLKAAQLTSLVIALVAGSIMITKLRKQTKQFP